MGGGDPVLNNAHQLGGICSGERVNKGGAVCCLRRVAMAEKDAFSEVVLSERGTVGATFVNDAHQIRP